MTTTDSTIAEPLRVSDRTRFFIDGAWQDPHSTERHNVIEAATGEQIAVAALGDEVDVDRAVRAARAALSGPWGRTTAGERAAVMRRFADALEARAELASTLVTRENGMPIGLSRPLNGAAPAAFLRLYADMIEQTPLEEIRPSANGSTIVRREPVGVVGAIVPWNYPLVLAMSKLAPALAAGCTIVLKPSPETALDSYLFADAATEAGLPEGVLNIVLADRDAGMALVRHPEVDKIAFTGSTEAGRIIAAECGRLIRRCTLELGGKSASVFLRDGDLDTFINGLPTSTFQNNSQTCTTQSRVLIERSRYEEVVDALGQYASKMRVGNPLDESVECGPMAGERHLKRVLGYIEQGRASARLVAGGGRPADLDRGWFVEPTVFADVDNRSSIAQEEIFGPVIVAIPFDTEEDAVRIANDSEYGLAGSIWTADEERGLDIARRIRTGTIGLNYYDPDLTAPFGGMKNSGLGREFGAEGLNHYFEYKSVYASARWLDA
ncbi:aldehyde dehydrogenase [Streptomyces ipomoeae]|uniref:aldehyde dehydrogenase n=1 Tax=Streptomyces ipomoeae TaxID=103232 RepID=UPI001146347D|nr:aldehyde dehydrogenase [Streptomyces ipomoeae]MDX2937734.1 aldehyde dehydrogenase [Streptomyces ipomoeae]TQE17258.1 aldehyde dehydrogenase [Streptomyces ipomoeae]